MDQVAIVFVAVIVVAAFFVLLGVGERNSRIIWAMAENLPKALRKSRFIASEVEVEGGRVDQVWLSSDENGPGLILVENKIAGRTSTLTPGDVIGQLYCYKTRIEAGLVKGLANDLPKRVMATYVRIERPGLGTVVYRPVLLPKHIEGDPTRYLKPSGGRAKAWGRLNAG
jgi:hypothetical protein